LNSDLRPLIFVLGSTASGKTDLALNLAESNNGVIVNCDSIQIYKELNLGSAKPSPEEFQRVPHYLFDLMSAPDEITLGRYLRFFEDIISKIPMDKNIFVVGGTGFYFQGIEKGLLPVAPVNEAVMLEVMKQQSTPEGALALYQELQEKDPEAALKISLQDHYRTARAVQVIRSQNKTLTEIRKEFENTKKSSIRPLLKIGLQPEKNVLNDRIQLRTQKMIRAGLVEEVKNLIDQGLESWAPLSSVGYKQTVEFLKQKKSLDWLQSEIELRTRQLAKKQRTWFKRDPQVLWFENSQQQFEIQKQLSDFLNGNSGTGALDVR